MSYKNNIWLVVSNIFYLALWPDPLPAGRAAQAECRAGFGHTAVFAMVWGEPGPTRSWAWPPTAEVGTRGDLVAEIISMNADSVLVTLVPCGSRAKILGSVQVPADCTSLSIFDATLLDKEPFMVFVVDNASDVLYHPRGCRDDLLNIVELCSGIGIGTFGFKEAGMKIVAACDWSGPFVQAFGEIHPDVPIVHGDISDKEVIKKLHSLHRRPAVLMSGFSCQPFSAGGQQRGALDQRSGTLEQSLRVGHMLRSLVIVLECVQDAGTNAMVRKQLDQFKSHCGFHLSEVILKLEDVWVSRRTRWWAVLSANFLGQVPLRAFEHSEHPSIPRHILSSPMSVSDVELRLLELTGEELNRFLEFEPNLAQMFLRLDVKAPTALHSWGSQVVACRCLCRSSGFSAQTLSNRGLFGILIPVAGSGHGAHLRVRHPHPVEVGIWNGVPSSSWPEDLRLILAGLGQMCSPLHTVWIASHLQRHFDLVFAGTSQVDPQYQLDSLRALVMEHAAHVTLVPSLAADLPEPPVELPMDLPLDDVSRAPWSKFRHEGPPDSCTVVPEDDPVPCCLRLSDVDDTVAAVVTSWFEFTGAEPDRCKIVDCQSGLTLAYGHQAAGLCLWITKYPFQPDEECMDPDPDVPSPAVDFDAVTSNVPAACPADPAPSRLSEARPEPLTALDESRLLSVPAPHVADVNTVDALRRQTIDVEARKQILANQNALWADDELIWHVNQMIVAARKPSWALLDPMIASEALRKPSAGLLTAWIRSQPVKPTAILGVVMFAGHWTPFMWTWTPSCMIAASWDVPGSPPHEFSMLHTALALAVGSRTYTAHIVHRKFAVESYCGICALRFLDSMIRGKMLPTDLGECQYLHSVGRSLFAAHLDSVQEVPRPWIFGAGLDVKALDRLHSLLLEHGVEDSQLKNRASLLVQAIGVATAQKALTGGQPWRSLKQAANHCKPAFQLVLPEELEASVQHKAAQGGLRGKRKKGPGQAKQPAKPEMPAALDPAKLAIEADVFVGPDGSALSQLPMTALGPLASGVALVSMEEASPYLKASQLVSQGPLALLILNADEVSVPTTLDWVSVRAVLRCQANGEPLIAPSVLVQLGKQLVSQKQAESVPAVMHTAAACFKLSLYRDAVDGDWNQVVQSPVKYVLSLLEPVQTCTADQTSAVCHCIKWHPPPDAVVADPVIDVWRRQWVSSAFRPVAPPQADIFLVNVRLVDSLSDRVLCCSGRGGLFLEPRSLDGRDPLMDFQVLWLARTPLEELFRLQQCTPEILGLARLGTRLGVRCRVADAPGLAKTLKPNSVFLAAGAKLAYEVGPLPFGMDRLSVSKLCSAWQWQARPLQPLRAADGQLGNIWLVQASAPPPHPVIRYQGSEIVINTVPDKSTSSTSPAPKVVGSSATVKMCSKDAASPSTDPWLLNDPWAPASAALPRSLASTDASLKDFETRLEKSILSKLPPAGMEVDSTGEQEARLIALEHQVHALTAGQQQLDQKLDDSVARHESQYQALHSQVNQQMESHGHQMQALFSSQMQQIEALLSKKLRTE